MTGDPITVVLEQLVRDAVRAELADVLDELRSIAAPAPLPAAVDKSAAAATLAISERTVDRLIDAGDLPGEIRDKGQRTFRSITWDGREIEFSGGFTDLHTLSYEKILAGEGYGLEAVRTAIQTVYDIRNSNPLGLKGDYHPILKNIQHDL